MKKTLLSLALLLLLGINPLRAQYHNIGDTVWYYDSIWWAPQWYTDWVSPANMPNATSSLIDAYGNNDGESLMRHITDRPIRVIGIACCIRSGNELLETGFDSMTSAQEYFLIYGSMPGKGVTPLRSVPWNPEAPHRYLESRLTSSPDNCQTYEYSPWPSVKPLYEVYFEDNPLVITDTFYIGCSFHSDTIDLWSSNRACGYALESWVPNCPTFPRMATVTVLDRDGIYLLAGVPYVRYEQSLWCIFPILSQDTDFAMLDSCPAAGNVWLDTAGGGSILRWEADSLHVQWRVGIGDTGTAPDSLWLDTLLETPFLDLAPLGIAPPFSVQVRPQCLCYEYYNVWGDWGDCTVILPPPDTCRPVTDLQYLPSGYGQGTLVWTPDSLHTLWQVAIGDTGTAPEQAWLDTLVTSPFLAIDSLGLPPDPVSGPTFFTAHVRARCGADPVSGTTFNWSPWSEGLFVDPLAGLTAIAAPAATLLPNPASGKVTVAVPDPVSGPTSRLKGVEVYSLTGSKMLTLTADAATELSFDVSSWPPATYLVVILTPASRTVKRLVVQ